MNHPPFEVRRRAGCGPYVLVCDHASNFVPEELNQLGLTEADLSRHIAWDIGAAAVAEILSQRFDSPLILGGTSRLVIDCNRHLNAPDLIPQISDGTIVPGNCDLTDAERQTRVQRFFRPYHDAVEEILDHRRQAVFLSVHSMTECLRGQWRPWPVSLASFEDRSLVDPLLSCLRAQNEFLVGDNQPYDLHPNFDYSTPQHAIRRGLPHLQVEFRQDEIANQAGQNLWANRFADALEKSRALASPAS
jgi:predicted N-formylglutamate amidohydrolase